MKYVDERALDEANRIVINAYNKYALPNFWGNGSSASADGTQWSVYPDNIQTEYHIRYGSWGGIGYYHVSNKMIAIHARFNTCGSHESNYILDALLDNDSDIQPDTLHGDTHAQALPVFALSWALAIKLLPRIRGVGHLAFARPDKKVKYRNIDSLFTEVVDWDLIEKHYRDVMRVVVSVKLGRISSSTILRRLGTPSRKDKVYTAFRELGKAIRTLFLWTTSSTSRCVGRFMRRPTIPSSSTGSSSGPSSVATPSSRRTCGTSSAMWSNTTNWSPTW